jgi:hypothetical protein
MPDKPNRPLVDFRITIIRLRADLYRVALEYAEPDRTWGTLHWRHCPMADMASIVAEFAQQLYPRL